MLSDRGYMHMNPMMRNVLEGRRLVWILIAVNVFSFLLIPPSSDGLYRQLVMSPIAVEHGAVYQIVTAMFLHGDFWHLLFNMWGLYLFGMLVAPHLGAVKFGILYFVSGIVGNLLFWAFNAGEVGGLVGASGALFGVMLACAMLEPNREFMILFFPAPIKCRTMVVVYAIVELLFVRNNDGIAHLAHLGGFVGGYIVMRILFRAKDLPWDITDLFRRFRRSGQGPRVTFSRPEAPSSGEGESAPISQRELDRLLDKISEQGINSLSSEELATLRRAREHLRQR